MTVRTPGEREHCGSCGRWIDIADVFVADDLDVLDVDDVRAAARVCPDCYPSTVRRRTRARMIDDQERATPLLVRPGGRW